MGEGLARRALRSTTAIAVVVAFLRAAAACTTTPELAFVGDASTLTTADATSDALVIDANVEDVVDLEDAGPDARNRNTCPDAAPPNVDQCCGRVRCVGKGCADNRCDECRVCAAGGVCCIKKPGAPPACAPNPQACK